LASLPKNRSSPAPKAFSSSRKNSRRNSRARTLVLQGLAPGVENHGHAELGAEIFKLSLVPRLKCMSGDRHGKRI
jgi:hypothetical protein